MEAIRERDFPRPVDLANHGALADEPAIALFEGNPAGELRAAAARVHQAFTAQPDRKRSRPRAEQLGEVTFHVHATAIRRHSGLEIGIQFRTRHPMRIDGRDGARARRRERNDNNESGEALHPRSMTNERHAS